MPHARPALALALLALSLGAPLATRADAPYTSDTPAQIQARLAEKKAVLLDVREPAEWSRGHLQQAALLPLSDLQTWKQDGLSDADRARLSEAAPKGAIVYTHCAKGGRAAIAGEYLRTLGYDVRPLKQGFTDLLEAGFPRAPEPAVTP